MWHHSSLAVSDLDTAMDFYRQAFGFELLFAERNMSDQIESIAGIAGLTCDIAQLRVPQSAHVLELIAFRTPDPQPAGLGDKPVAPGAAHVAFYVDDLEATIRRVEALGAVRVGRVTRFSEGRSVYYREPAGSFFEIEQPNEETI
jgi:predicted enzyme related to lactoylglutathione lyase